jgi:lipid-binding SYLF domain-containing protein
MNITAWSIKMNSLSTRISGLGILLVMAIFVVSNPALADKARDAQKLVDASYYAFMDLTEGNAAETMNTLLNEARAVMIFPSVSKGGFIFGAEVGNGVLLSKHDDGHWSYPAFYGMGSVSFGLQAGVQRNRILLIIIKIRVL